MSDIMLFPLGAVILPEGKMRLRIFEPRYKRLVTEASKGDNTFGICLFESEPDSSSGSLSATGTLVRIVDFEALDDGLLGITVVGLKRFLIQQVRFEPDGLRIARVEWLSTWPDRDLTPNHQTLSRQLQSIYQQIPELGQLYDQCFFDNESWVAQRWLELLPLKRRQFDHLTLQPDCSQALDFLDQAIEVEK